MASTAAQQLCRGSVFYFGPSRCAVACPKRVIQGGTRDCGEKLGRGRVGGNGRGKSRQVVIGRVGAIFGVGPREEKPSVLELEAITGEEHFNEVMAQAQAEGRGVVIEWMASWCRKCIYLKPKLERLAAEFHPAIRFYCVDVNSVPSSLVKRAEVTKMPTIQLWYDGVKKDEVIGGHKAWLVMDEIRHMLRS